ncbi:g7354 [Coccomyxa viridis]|uniref:G7354 protein n=1 Tax=Coccomyxa viridis TaxID=1274662 RepID=A0ABP1FYS4_9CHLO
MWKTGNQGEPSTLEQARRGVDNAHLNAKVIQLDLANMAASPPHSPSEKKDTNGVATPKQVASAAVEASNLRSMSETQKAKFKRLLELQVVDLDALRELAWSGRKKGADTEQEEGEYRDMVPNDYDIQAAERSVEDDTALRQVVVDVPRTAHGVPFFAQKQLQKSLERILYLWGIRHPASGYVQGINDLVTPFLAVFLLPHMEGAMGDETETQFPEEDMICAEADAYWCLCKLLDGIQDHYTHAQPGIQRTVFRLEELVRTTAEHGFAMYSRRIDEPFTQHLESEGLEFPQFTFRWVNCLLIREIPFKLAIRLWDTYLAEGTHMREFLTYVLAAFLLT